MVLLSRRRLVLVLVTMTSISISFVVWALLFSRGTAEITTYEYPPRILDIALGEEGLLVSTLEGVYHLDANSLKVKTVFAIRKAASAIHLGHEAVIVSLNGVVAKVDLRTHEILSRHQEFPHAFTKVLSASSGLEVVELANTRGERVVFDVSRSQVVEIGVLGSPLPTPRDGIDELPWLSKWFSPREIDVVSRHGRRLVVVGRIDGNAVTVFDARTGLVEVVVENVSGGVTSVVWIGEDEFVLGTMSGILYRVRLVE